VMPLAAFSVSTRPAFLTAVTSVDSTGLADAAVATGAVAMPVKLPAPVLGTDEHAGPKSVVLADEPEAPDAIADDDDDAMGDDELCAAVGVLDEDEEVHAAAPMATLAAIPDTASRRTFFTVSPLWVFWLTLAFGAGTDGCRPGLR
jgi:hypothetical protein